MSRRIAAQPTSAELLGPTGPLAATLPDFAPRPSQQELATRIEQALEHPSIFIAESGTGTGKTFAYLVPALRSGRKVLISTGTRNLQDQLFTRDVPRVRDALGVPVACALLKGRGNYLCLHRLERAVAEARLASRAEAADLRAIGDWSRRTRSGDVAELAEVPEDSTLWPQVTSTADNCLGAKCDRYDDCFVNRARREALAAEVLVVNHHLFFADLALREDGFGQLLPGVDAVIFDEAHQLPEVATNFFGVTLSGSQLLGLARDAAAEEVKEKSGVPGIAASAARLEKASADFRLALGREPRRDPWHRLESSPGFHPGLLGLRAALGDLGRLLLAAGAKGAGLAKCSDRAAELLDRLELVADRQPAEFVTWIETSTHGFVVRLTPLDIAPLFRPFLDENKSWIFTSATLAVGGRFDHFQGQLGIEAADCARWESPFDYAHQALLYLPDGLPEPAAPDYTERVLEAALPVLAASRGRAFLLFTSHRALRLAADWLPSRITHPLFVQGSAPRAELLERFRGSGDGVLLGTASFWEGVDVRGEALSCVIIDKLPFAAPDDPVLAARAAALEASGRSPFREMQLPAAVLALKQGAGRLIRDETDRGVLMICDPRLLTKGYGKTFLASLPPMPRTPRLSDVQAFFART